MMRMLGAGCAIRLAMVLAVSLPGAADGQDKPAGDEPAGVRNADAATLLANVTHLTDNDVRFRTRKGISVFVDPMAGPAEVSAARGDMARPDLILLTHAHLDHFNALVLREYAKRNPDLVLAGPADVVKYAQINGIKMTEVRPGQDLTLAGIRFRTVPAYFVDDTAHPRENGWVGFVLRIDGATYYVTGDTQPLPEMAEVEADVLFPLVYGCGGNLDQAVEMVALCKPSVVVPVHTGGGEDVIKEFLARLPQGVQGAYYRKGRLVAGSRAAAR